MYINLNKYYKGQFQIWDLSIWPFHNDSLAICNNSRFYTVKLCNCLLSQTNSNEVGIYNRL